MLVALDGERGRGSGRSLPGLDLNRAARRAAATCSRRYGGHAFAAGLTVRARAAAGAARALRDAGARAAAARGLRAAARARRRACASRLRRSSWWSGSSACRRTGSTTPSRCSGTRDVAVEQRAARWAAASTCGCALRDGTGARRGDRLRHRRPGARRSARARPLRPGVRADAQRVDGRDARPAQAQGGAAAVSDERRQAERIPSCAPRCSRRSTSARRGSTATGSPRASTSRPRAHGDQRRESGEPYVTHVVEVCLILLDLLEARLDTTLACAALLHDVVEDTDGHARGRREALRPRGRVAGRGRHQARPGCTSTAARPRRPRTSARCCCRCRATCASSSSSSPTALHNMRTIEFLQPDKRAAHRRGDARHLRAARAPARHGRHQARARGPEPQGARPGGLPGAGAAHPGAARGARGVPRRGCSDAARGGAQGRRHQGRGERAAQALLLDLQEDAAPGATSRTIYDLFGAAHHHAHAQRLLSRARRGARPVHAGARTASRTTSPRPRATCTSRCTPRC